MQHIMHLATVAQGLNNLYVNYLKPWSFELAVIAITVGAILWMCGSAVGNSAGGAVGLRVVAVVIIGIAIIMGAVDLVNIGKGLAF